MASFSQTPLLLLRTPPLVQHPIPTKPIYILNVADPHSRPPRRGRRIKPRRNTSLSTSSTSYFSDSLSTVDHNYNHTNDEGEHFQEDIHDDESSTNSIALSTEVSDDLYFAEIEKLLDEATDSTTAANAHAALRPTVSIAAKMQARLLSKHLKTRRLRRVVSAVSHSAASSMQDDVNMLNEVSDAAGTSNGLRTVLSFSDMRRRDAEEHEVLTDHILENILEEDEEEVEAADTAHHTTSKERDVETTLALILLTKQQLPCTNNKHIAQI